MRFLSANITRIFAFCALSTICLWAFLNVIDIHLTQSTAYQFGWSRLVNYSPQIWSYGGVILFTLLVCVFPKVRSQQTEETLLASILFLTNPIFLHCFSTSYYSFWPALLITLSYLSIKLHTKLNMVHVALFGCTLPILTYHSLEGLVFSFVILGGSVLLLPPLVIIRHGIKSIFILTAPSIFIIFGINYLMWTDLVPSFNFSFSGGELSSTWAERHTASFATAFFESIIWLGLLIPCSFWLLFSNSKPHTRLLIFSILIPPLAVGLSTDMGIALTPIAYFALPLTLQFLLLLEFKENYLLVSSLISWLGSILIVWYYVL